VNECVKSAASWRTDWQAFVELTRPKPWYFGVQVIYFGTEQRPIFPMPCKTAFTAQSTGDLDRRTFLKRSGAAAAVALLAGSRFSSIVDAGEITQLARFPEKTDLLLLTDRPPQLETPLRYYLKDLTPNEAFFVRWHMSGIPTSIDTRQFRLVVGGAVERPLQLSLQDLRRDFEAASLVAVAQCSGNSRSFFSPRVPGGQWGNGAVGNAKWTGVRLRDLLKRAGVKDSAVDVSFAGMDRPPLPGIAPFVKSLDLAHASDGEVMVAYAMNGADLPMLNGFPLRLIVPGWYATYWVKALSQINVLSEKFHGFWMDKAYRIPNNAHAEESPDKLATDTVPISRHSVRSLLVLPEPDARINLGAPIEVQGIALDAGDGIRRVEVSTDAGQTWNDAALDAELGKYSWRRWRYRWTPSARGDTRICSRATNAAGQTQVMQQWNRSGYQYNVIQSTQVHVI
jgi:DMSO/TMAO reductase YedYZ molybdopterin-dependent catalytic subunit